MFFDGKPALLRAFREGDRKVLRDVYAAYGEVVHRYCRDRLKGASDARDLTQECFITAFKDDARLRFSGLSSFQGFLLGIAKNLLLHRFRADRVREAGAEQLTAETGGMEPSEPPPVDRRLEEEAVDKLLADFVAELDERERRFFQEHMVPRPPRRQTAEKLGMSEDQVRYLEKKLKERAVEFLKRVGYLDVAGAELKKAAAAALLLLAVFPNFLAAPEHPCDGSHIRSMR
ncbi:MAG TPA: sigma-70 family RNA polymerase sigma factor [Myxococcales bacterium]|jgi:RNA polymerase sigma factor (sigma-70 family)